MQRNGVYDWAVALGSSIVIITKPCFPIPCLQIVPKLAQITLETDGKPRVIRCDLVAPHTRFQSTVTDSGGKLGSRRSGKGCIFRKKRRASKRCVIGLCERIEWILNRYANAPGAANPDWAGGIVEYV